MTIRRISVYECDGCGVKVDEKRELRRFSVHDHPWKNTASFDLCDDCEAKFVAGLVADCAGEDVAAILRREP